LKKADISQEILPEAFILSKSFTMLPSRYKGNVLSIVESENMFSKVSSMVFS
jgi:hypothetical protein